MSESLKLKVVANSLKITDGHEFENHRSRSFFLAQNHDCSQKGSGKINLHLKQQSSKEKLYEIPIKGAKLPNVR